MPTNTPHSALSAVTFRRAPRELALLCLALLMMFAAVAWQVRDEQKKVRANAMIDIRHYYATAMSTQRGELVHRDFDSEYPAAAAIIEYAPMIGSGPIPISPYLIRFILMSGAIVAIAILLVSLRLVRAEAAAKTACIGMAGLLFGAPLMLLRLDGIVAALAMVGVALFLHRPPGDTRRIAFLSGFLISLAGSFKLFAYPAMVLFGLRETPGRRGHYWSGVALGTLPTLALAILGPQGFLHFLAYHSQRKIEVGSLYALPSLVSSRPELIREFGSIQIHFAGENMVVALAGVLTAVATLAPIVLALRRRATAEVAFRFSALSILGFVLFNKVGSPQYAAWVFLFLLPAAMRPTPQVWRLLLLALAYLVAARLSLTFFRVEGGLGQLIFFLLTKHLLAIALYAILWRWALEPAPSPAHEPTAALAS